jgi:hypothetical protein
MSDKTETNDPIEAVSRLYQAYITGMILAISSQCGASVAGDWIFRLFRRQHETRFLPGLDKLGLADKPHAVACAGYHYLSNRIGGVDVQFMAESDTKAWVRFPPPRWFYDGAAICGVPSEVSRGMLWGWYARNGVSLGNPRLGFICTGQTTDGQPGLAGYFLEHDRDLAPEERLRFSPGERPPPYDPEKAPALDTALWTEERKRKAKRNYALEYVRTGLTVLAEAMGPSRAADLAAHAGRLIGMQLGPGTARLLGVEGEDPAAAARLLAALAGAEGDTACWRTDGDGAIVERDDIRLFKGLKAPASSLLDGWSGLLDGLAMSVAGHVAVTRRAGSDRGGAAWSWRIDPAAR